MLKKILAWVIGITVLGTGIAYASSQMAVKSLQAIDYYPKMAIGYISGSAEGTWELLDYHHLPIGLGTVTQTDEYIRVYWTRACDTYGLAGVITADDNVMNGLGYDTGTSSGASYTNIYIHDKDGNLINPSSITYDSAEITVMMVCKET